MGLRGHARSCSAKTLTQICTSKAGGIVHFGAGPDARRRKKATCWDSVPNILGDQRLSGHARRRNERFYFAILGRFLMEGSLTFGKDRRATVPMESFEEV